MITDAGKQGEAYTAKQMKKQGYKILDQNFHSRFGELDIVAAKGEYIVFVEVKTRAPGAMVSPFEAVSRAKQQKLVCTAQLYLQCHRVNLQPRFDVAGVIIQNGNILDFSYLENAFTL